MSNNQGRRKRPPQQRNRPKANGHRPAAPEQNGHPIDPPSISTKGRKLSEEKVVLFQINDHDYLVPEKPTTGMVLKVIHEMRTKGEPFGLDLAMEMFLGEEDYQRYMDVVDYLEDDENEAIADAVRAHLRGAQNAGKGQRS